MRIFVCFALSILVGLLPCGPAPAAAQDTASPDFTLGPPHILKAEWQNALLRVGDVNGDGRLDLLSVNNQRNLLDIFEQDADTLAFEKREEVLTHGINDMLLADFDGDGNDDLVMSRPNEDLVIRYQKDGALGPEVPLECPSGLLEGLDIDGDDRNDALSLTQNRLVILHGDDGLHDAEPLVYYNTSTPGSRPAVCDLDGNGLADIAYLDSQRRSRLMVRFQRDPRVWGLERAYELSDTAEIEPLRGEDGDPDEIAAIDSRTREIRLYRLVENDGVPEVFPLGGPLFLGLDPRSRSDRDQVVSVDLQGDGLRDLLIASPRAAEMYLYLQDKEGRLTMRSAASLSDIQALATIERPDGEALVFSLSDAEETVGVSKWDAGRGLTVPQLLDTTHKPLAIATADWDRSGTDDFLYLYREDEKTLELRVYSDPEDTGVFETEPEVIALPGENEWEAEYMEAGDLNADGLPDLMIHSVYEPIQVFLNQGDEGLVSFATDRGIRKGVFNNRRPGHITVANVDDQPGPEVLVASDNFVRAYRIVGTEEMELVDQFNGKDIGSRIESVALADLDGDGVREVVLLDAGNQLLTIYSRNGDDKYELARNHAVPGVRGMRLLADDLNDDGVEDLIVYSGGAVQFYPANSIPEKMEPIWRHAPEPEEAKYAVIEPLELGAYRNGPELVALEGTDYVLEFFGASQKPNGLSPVFRFKVFDDPESVSRNRSLREGVQPRQITAGDLNGDGKNDLILLMHDNIVWYLNGVTEED